MSADNGIYILETAGNKFRVAETSAIDNLDWHELHQPYNIGAYMLSIWGKSSVYDKVEDACVKAQELYNEIMEGPYPMVEYGIQRINTGYVFFGDIS